MCLSNQCHIPSIYLKSTETSFFNMVSSSCITARSLFRAWLNTEIKWAWRNKNRWTQLTLSSSVSPAAHSNSIAMSRTCLTREGQPQLPYASVWPNELKHLLAPLKVSDVVYKQFHEPDDHWVVPLGWFAKAMLTSNLSDWELLFIVLTSGNSEIQAYLFTNFFRGVPNDVDDV